MARDDVSETGEHGSPSEVRHDWRLHAAPELVGQLAALAPVDLPLRRLEAFGVERLDRVRRALDELVASSCGSKSAST